MENYLIEQRMAEIQKRLVDLFERLFFLTEKEHDEWDRLETEYRSLERSLGKRVMSKYRERILDAGVAW